MKQILFFTLVFSFSFFSETLFAAVKVEKGFVKLSDGIERYVEYSAPNVGKPWIVFTNGLVYELERWSPMDAELRAQGFGILHYYFRGQDWTLEREAEKFGKPLFFKNGLESEDFAHELEQVLAQLRIQEKVVVVGLSYGAHIAASFAEVYPERVEQVVFLAPLVKSLDKYEPQGAWLDWNLAWARAVWGPYFYEAIYRQIYQNYLDQRVSDRIPDHLRAIPEIYKESLFHLVRAVRDFDLRHYSFKKLTDNSVFYLLGQEDKPQIFQDQILSFEGTDSKSQGSLIWLPESSHAIPDSEPTLAARYLQHIIARDPRLEQGRKYKSTPEGLTHW